MSENMMQFLTIILAFIAFLLTIGSFLWMARNDYRHLDAKIDAIQKEIKDFHIRLEKQDNDFKNFMKSEEQKRTQLIIGSK